jgi:hypothetical protein
MTDEKNDTIRRVEWGEVFSFPKLFRGFELAKHPSKMALGIVMLVLVFAAGWVLDGIWVGGGAGVLPGQITTFVATNGDIYDAQEEAAKDARLQQAARLYMATHNGLLNLNDYKAQAGIESTFVAQAFNERLQEAIKKSSMGSDADPLRMQQILKQADEENEDYADLIGKAEESFDKEVDLIEELLDDLDEAAEKKISDAPLSDDQKEKAREAVDLGVAQAHQGLSKRRLQFRQAVQSIEGVGVFALLVDYQTDCLYNAICAVGKLNFTGGLSQYQRALQARQIPTLSTDIASGLPDPAAATNPNQDPPGAIYYALMALEGIRWLIVEHFIYAVIFLLWCLIVTSLFGGAIYRMSAIQATRGEKISIGQALSFSRKKFFSFFSVPLIPLAIIFVLAGLMTIGGLIGTIPVVGTFIVAVLFILGIVLGLCAAFILIGLVAGWPLMYPTIATEGSDSLDGIARSVSYIFEQPFRAVLYGVIAAIYGAITYLFVRFFAWLGLYLTHGFVKWGAIAGGDSLAPQADWLDVLWAKPIFWNLHDFNWVAAGGWDGLCAVLIAGWVNLVVAAVAAYLLCYFASSSTLIYLLLRRKVDATDLNDVFIAEELEEDLMPPAEAPAEADEDASDEDQGEADDDKAEKEDGSA